MVTQYKNGNGDRISMKEYFEVRISSLEKATTLAAQQMDQRLAGMNEFRNSLKDQANTLLPRTEHDILVSKMNEDVTSLRSAVTSLLSRAEHDIQMQRIDEDIKALRDTKNYYIPRAEHDIQHVKLDNDIRELRESKATLEGKASQSSVNIAFIISIVGILISVIGTFRGFLTPPTFPVSSPAIVQPAK